MPMPMPGNRRLCAAVQTRMSCRLRFCAVPLLASLLAGCTASSFVPQSRPALRLVAYDSCAQLLTELRAAARQSVGPYGFAGSEPPVIAEGGARTMVSDGAVAAAQVPGPAEAYSGTNVQEQGVDEPDMVKTDGRRIVVVDDGVLRVIDPVSRAETGRLKLGDQAFSAQVLLSGDRALVLISSPGYGVLERRIRPLGSRPEVLLVDLSGAPRLISRYRGEGTLVDARQNGSVARVVLSSTPKIRLPLSGESPDGSLRQSRAAIGAAPLDAWLPGWEVTTGATTTKGRLDCGAVSRPASFSGTSMLSVLTFDLNAPALDDGSPVGLVTDGDTVYGTPTSLYVANNQRWRLNAVGESAAVGGSATFVAPAQNTEIYRFALSGSAKPVFTSSGIVPGLLLNQYAMSEWDGHLRVATTDATESASAVRVLHEQGGKLAQIGEVGGLGKGERIYAVRFIGPRGYVVTFKQTDPLYSLDLSDPAAPRVTGTLKITGYSAHLQPVGADRLVGIGQEASSRGRQLGMQISLFDVADAAHPRRLDQQHVPGGQSEAEFDPHALLWWPATGLLVVPVADASTSGSLALRVTGDRLQPAAQLQAPNSPGAPIRRSLVVGDVLWSVTDTGVLASDLSTLDQVGWVPFT
jgi:uncharacterized secreted protein with C-terminal beta-propeller domain